MNIISGPDALNLSGAAVSIGMFDGVHRGPRRVLHSLRERGAALRLPTVLVTFDPHRGWRNVKVTDRRAAVDYAQCMRELVDVHYPDAACIRVVQDNLSIHKPGALYEASRPPMLDASCAASNSTSLRNTPVGSTWSSARSACCSASVSAVALPIVSVCPGRS